MLVTRTSPFTGIPTTKDLNVTQEQLQQVHNREGLIQDILSQLSPSDREFIKSGYTQEDWLTMFPPDDQEWVDNEP